MAFFPYIHFPGTCEQAMAFYAKVFGATDVQLMRYSDAPPDGDMPKSDLIMHSQMTVGSGTLMASDFPDGQGEPQQAMSVMVSVKEARAAFDGLADGAQVIVPFGPTFWSTGFGMLKDRFGTHWIIDQQTDTPPPNH